MTNSHSVCRAIPAVVPRELKGRRRGGCLQVEKKAGMGYFDLWDRDAQRRTDSAIKIQGNSQKTSMKWHKECQRTRSSCAMFLSRPAHPLCSAQLFCPRICQSTEPSPCSAINSTFISQFQKSRREKRWLALLESHAHASSVNWCWGVGLWDKDFRVFIKLL